MDACIRLLSGQNVPPRIVYGLGGPPAKWAVTSGEPGPDYWLRVWALRGLLWNWNDSARSAVLDALTDDAWRAREMAAKVVARHRLDVALELLIVLQDDPLPRVRQAATRAIRRLTESG